MSRTGKYPRCVNCNAALALFPAEFGEPPLVWVASWNTNRGYYGKLLCYPPQSTDDIPVWHQPEPALIAFLREVVS